MKYLNYLFVIILTLISCKGKDNNSVADNREAEKGNIAKVLAVSVYDGVPIRQEPSKDGKYLSSLNLGETMFYLGEEITDSVDSKRTYYKVELSDETVAWARTYGILIQAQPGAIVTETPVYKRPDLVNKTNETFYPMEYVAIVGEKDDWVEVVGARKKKSGWIKKQNITTADEDVAVATLAYKELLTEEGLVKIDEASEFLESLPYASGQFESYLQDLIDEHVGLAVEEAIENMELESDMEMGMD